MMVTLHDAAALVRIYPRLPRVFLSIPRIADLYSGWAKTDARDAFIITPGAAHGSDSARSTASNRPQQPPTDALRPAGDIFPHVRTLVDLS